MSGRNFFRSLRNVFREFDGGKKIIRFVFLKFAEGLTGVITAFALAKIADGALFGSADAGAARFFVALLFAVSLKAVFVFWQKNIAANLSADLRKNIREKLHAALFRTKKTPPAEILTLALETVDALDGLFRLLLPFAASVAVTMPLFFAVMLAVDPLSALIFALTVGIAPVILSLIGMTAKEAGLRQWENMLALQKEFVALLEGAMTIAVFRRTEDGAKRLGEASDDFAAAALRALAVAFVASFAAELIATLSIALVAVNVGLRLLAGELNFFVAFFALVIAPEFYAPLRNGGIVFHAGAAVKIAWEKISAYVGEETATKKTAARTEQAQLPPSAEMKNVSFSFAGQEIFSGLNLVIPAGKIVAVKGASGAGKTTLLRLLARLVSPSDGEIFYSGRELSRISKDDLSRHIAYMPQEPHIFCASLRENVSLFQTVPAAEIIAALNAAALGAWFASLPNGLDTALGEGGILPSVGERKRIGLARVFLRGAPLVLLDEATAGLDEKTEAAVLASLADFARRRTVVMTAHRPAALAVADVVVELGESS